MPRQLLVFFPDFTITAVVSCDVCQLYFANSCKKSSVVTLGILELQSVQLTHALFLCRRSKYRTCRGAVIRRANRCSRRCCCCGRSGSQPCSGRAHDLSCRADGAAELHQPE